MQNITDAFKGKTLVITGGTGSFGSTVLKHFLTSDIGEIRIFSRDEKKQDWMRHTLQARYPEYASKVKFFIGDVRNIDSVRDALYGANYIFHAAALKEVPSCEFFPMEAVKTNIIGTDNVITAAVENRVERVVFLSDLGIHIQAQEQVFLSPGFLRELLLLQWLLHIPIYIPSIQAFL